MEVEDDWWPQFIHDGDDFRSSYDVNLPLTSSSSILGYPIQHNQRLDAPDMSHGPNLGSPTRNPDHAGDVELPSSKQQLPPVDELKSSQSTIEESESQSLAHQAAKPRIKNARIPGGYPCPDCDRRPFNTASEMQKHQYQVHTLKSDRPFGCASCEERFLYQKDLKRHLASQAHDSRSSARQDPQVDCTFPQSSSTLDDHNTEIEPTQPKVRSFDADNRAVKSVKRRRCDSPPAERIHGATGQHASVLASSPPFESNHYHNTADEFLVAGYQDLRRFSNLRATQITIIATMEDLEETTTFIAHHKLSVISGLEPPPKTRTRSKVPRDDQGTKAASCVLD